MVDDSKIRRIAKRIYAPFFQIRLDNYYRLKKNHVSFKRLLLNGRINIRNQGTVSLGNNVIIRSGTKYNALGNSTAFEVYRNATLIIGDGVCMSNVRIRCDKQIIIENDVMLGGGVILIDSNCHSLDFNERMFSKDGGVILSAPIHIKRGAFIGTGALILKGVTIGEEAIIAAGAVVTENVPDHEVWGGNPARLIRKRE